MHQVSKMIRGISNTEPAHPVKPFALENGRAQLAKYFQTVRRFEGEDGLVVTEAEPLVAYILSTRLASSRGNAEMKERLRTAISEHIERDGAFHTEKSPGRFEASVE